MRISDLSSDGCSSDLSRIDRLSASSSARIREARCGWDSNSGAKQLISRDPESAFSPRYLEMYPTDFFRLKTSTCRLSSTEALSIESTVRDQRSEEHTSELQYLMRISSAVFCLKKKK